MTNIAYILFILYAMELITMMVAIGYVGCLFMQKKPVLNKYLQGRRLKVAALLPVIWFTYTFTDAYTVYQAGSGVHWVLPDQSLRIKIIMQAISLIGGLIVAMFVMGCKFGDK